MDKFVCNTIISASSKLTTVTLVQSSKLRIFHILSKSSAKAVRSAFRVLFDVGCLSIITIPQLISSDFVYISWIAWVWWRLVCFIRLLHFKSIEFDCILINVSAAKVFSTSILHVMEQMRIFTWHSGGDQVGKIWSGPSMWKWRHYEIIDETESICV